MREGGSNRPRGGRAAFRNRVLLLRIARFAAPYRSSLLGLAALIVVGTALPLAPPVLVRSVVDDLIAGESFSDVRTPIGLFLVFGLVAVAANFVGQVLAARVGFHVIADLQRILFDRFAAMPLGFFTTVRPGTLVSRMTNDVYATEPLFTTIVASALSNAVTLVGAAVVLILVDVRLALIFLLIPLVLLPIRFAEAKINDQLRRSFEENSRLSSSIESLLTRDGILLARQAGQMGAETGRFAALTESLRALSVLGARWRAAVGASYDTVFNLTTAGVLALGAWLVTSGDASVGTLLLFLLYVRLTQGAVSGLAGLRYPTRRAEIAFQRVFDVLDTPAQRPRSLDGQEVDGTVRPEGSSLIFKHVQFRYPPVGDVSIPGLSYASAVSIAGLPITGLATEGPPESAPNNATWTLHGVDFAIGRREMVAVVGASGAGKSTIALLAAGLVLPDNGRILLDGRDTRSLAEEAIARKVAFVTQETHVLPDTIANNLRYASPCTGSGRP